VILATKAMHVKPAAESAKALLGPETPVLSIQNGLGGPDIGIGVRRQQQEQQQRGQQRAGESHRPLNRADGDVAARPRRRASSCASCRGP